MLAESLLVFPFPVTVAVEEPSATVVGVEGVDGVDGLLLVVL